MQTFYVSMAADLLGVFIEYRAESRLALEQYLERQYLRNGVWKIPWCAIYREHPKPQRTHSHRRPSPLSAEPSMRR